METIESWQEWELVAQAEATDTCMSCDGDGHHGYDEADCPHICYGCGGTGKYFPYPKAA